MANFIYNKAKELFAKGELDWESADLRLLLLRDTGTYQSNEDKDHDFLDHVLDASPGGGVEISASGYARQTLAGKAVTLDLTNDWAKCDCDDIAFGALTAGQTVIAAVLFVHTGSNATAPLIAWIDTATGLTGGFATNGGTVTITIAADGLIKLT